MKISVVIIARDKTKILPQCLETASQVSDDIVIVTNQDHKFVNFSDQKNYAASKCKYDWILSLDDDEWLSPKLIDELRTINYEPYTAFKIPRQNIIFGKVMKFTNWGPSDDTHIWLYNKHKCKWTGEVHELVKTDGKVGSLQGQKVHQNYNSVKQYIDKLDQYTSLEAIKRPVPLWWLPFYPCWKFIRHYFVYLGFLDGWHGFFLSYLQAIYGMVVVVKSWQKKNIS